MRRPVQAAPGGVALGVGLAGFGYAGRTFHAPLLTTTPGLELRAVCSAHPDAVSAALGPQVAVEGTFGALLVRSDIDLVVLATPNDTHFSLAQQALQAHKHVVIDKPMALDADEGAALVQLARRQHRLLSVFHNRRWDGDFRTVADLVGRSDAGGEPAGVDSHAARLGRIAHAELNFDRFRPTVRERWREAAGPAGGLWLDLGPHLIDQALQLFGRPQAVRADIAALRDADVPHANDWFEATLRYASGLRVTLGASMLTARPRARFALYGTAGTYAIHGLDPQEDALKAGQQPDPTQPEAWGHDPRTGALRIATRPAGAGSPADAPALQDIDWPTQRGNYPAYYAAVRDALWGQGPNPVSPEAALEVMKLLDLGRRSALERRELGVD
jgi:predicted dehydrogenase